MDYHNCKDLPLWAQILVNCDQTSGHDIETAAETEEDIALPDRDYAA